MSERPTSQPDPEHLLELKDSISEHWQQLPPEHQASMMLVFVSQMLEGEYGAWLLGALDVLGQHSVRRPVQVLPIPPLTHSHLELAHLSEDEAAQFTALDLRRISHNMMEHYANDLFWEELEFHARQMLEQKRQK